MKKVMIAMLALAETMSPQNRTNNDQDRKEDTSTKSAEYAIRATLEIRDAMLDPTAFTVLQVVAITKQEKNGRTSFKGCVHYVGSTRAGGRLQAWGGYSVDKRNRLNSWPGGENGYCSVSRTETQTDVTNEVKKFLSASPPR
jgi:hypothetical protein